ncbi:MAG: transporter substrate-binding domain-containing protein [Flavobacteriaceae bacterium]
MKLKHTLIVAICGLLFILPTNAQETIKSIIKNGEFRVGLTGNQPPYHMKNRSGELMGYEIDIASAIANGMGVKLSVKEMPFSELLPALKAGKIDAVMSGMAVTATRSADFLFAGPYTVSGKSILAKSSNIEKLKGTEAANNENYRITCLKGSTSEAFARTSMPKSQIKTVANYEEGINMVLNDEVEAMVADYPICVITVMRNEGKDLVTLDGPLNIEPIGMALPAGDHHFLNLVENYIKALELSGLLQALDNKWMKDGAWLVNLK